MNSRNELPLPLHFNPDQVGRLWRVEYQERAREAELWARSHRIEPAYRDKFRVSLLLVDIQNTFCLPDFELYVGGRSGRGAIDDNRRVCEFIYRNLNILTDICPTMDTHQGMQIFHSIFLVNDKDEHPRPMTTVTAEDVLQGVWKFNENLCPALEISPEYGQAYLRHYTRTLQEAGKYDLTVWPYHAMLGGIGHALVSAVEESVFFHSVARYSRTDFQVKGGAPLTENYSVLSPEVRTGPDGDEIASRNQGFIQKLLDFDAVIIAGQAKSHCVAWTIDDLLKEIQVTDKSLARKVYLLEDCSSPVVVPGVVDYTEQAAEAFNRFSEAGMNVVRSTEPVTSWPGFAV